MRAVINMLTGIKKPFNIYKMRAVRAAKKYPVCNKITCKEYRGGNKEYPFEKSREQAYNKQNKKAKGNNDMLCSDLFHLISLPL